MRKILFYYILLFTNFIGFSNCNSILEKFFFAQKIENNYFKFFASETQNNFNFEAQLLSNNLLLNNDFILKVGNISYSGSYSLLSSPTLSSSFTPFSKANVTCSQIKSSSPNISSYSAPVSIFVQYTHNYKNNNFLSINGDYNLLENEFSLSIKKQINFAKNKEKKLFSSIRNDTKKIDFSFTFGKFLLDELRETSWKFKNDYYSSGNIICSQIQTGFSSNNFISLLIINSYVSPFGNLCLNFRNENQYKIKKTSLSLSMFYNSYNNYVSSSQKTIDEVLMIKVGIQNQKIVNNNLKKIGFVVLADFDLYNIQHDFKTSFGFSLSNKKYSFVNYINSNFMIKAQENQFNIEDFSYYNKNTFYFNKCTLKLNQTYNFYPTDEFSKWKTNQKFSCNISTKGSFIFLASGSLEVFLDKWKYKSLKPEFSISFTIKPKIKIKTEVQTKYVM